MDKDACYLNTASVLGCAGRTAALTATSEGKSVVICLLYTSRQRQKYYPQRLANGETLEALTEETWQLLCDNA